MNTLKFTKHADYHKNLVRERRQSLYRFWNITIASKEKNIFGFHSSSLTIPHCSDPCFFKSKIKKLQRHKTKQFTLYLVRRKVIDIISKICMDKQKKLKASRHPVYWDLFLFYYSAFATFSNMSLWLDLPPPLTPSLSDKLQITNLFIIPKKFSKSEISIKLVLFTFYFN